MTGIVTVRGVVPRTIFVSWSIPDGILVLPLLVIPALAEIQFLLWLALLARHSSASWNPVLSFDLVC